MSAAIHDWNELGEQARDALLARPAVTAGAATRERVAGIVAAVREDGDRAVRELTRRFDGVEVADPRVGDGEYEAALAALDPAALAAIDTAIDNVRRFHERQLPAPLSVEVMPGVRCERMSHALDAVGLYVPAGSAPLPSAAVMLSVPASIAGCPRRILCTPPRRDARADPAVVVAARRSGVTDIFRIGGAQAIAAMAYGTDTVPKVCKLFGPGNAWVTAAKSLVSADPEGAAIDMPAGPSEVLVIADGAARAEFVAADLLSQAEHGADSQVLLLTDSRQLAAAVLGEIDRQLANLSRAAIARQSLVHSRLILVDDIAAAVSISNRYAPEHLILQVAGARELLPDIRNAGSVFVGPWTPESVGDYCSGTNHVLPTYGLARSYSGLGVEQFMRQMTVQELTRDGLAGLGETVVTLANLEGLDAHAAAVQCRLGAAR
jgi:histidinol dehydrogenase